MRGFPAYVISSLILAGLVPLKAAAQTSSPPASSPGVRAAGMGGAFTAVADDASAVFWNPAGLASGAFFSLVLDRNTDDEGSASLIALGTPPLGLSYYRTATDGSAQGGPSLVAHHAGVTLLQSLGGRLAVGGTVKLVHGVVSAAGLPAVSSNKFDADLGIMAIGGLGRLGLTVHNVMDPDFAGPAGPIALRRRVRAGLSVNATRMTTVAADADLVGDGRQAALGVELRPARTAWIRSGVHWTTSGGGPAAPVGSVGGTYAVYGSTVADAQVTFGSDKGRRGWGVGLRFVF